VFGYTDAGLLAEYLAPDLGDASNPVSYTYNLDRQLTEVSFPDGRSITRSYDAGGRLAVVSFDAGEINRSYAIDTGRLQTLSSADGNALSYTYDGFLLARRSWTGEVVGVLENSYDNDFRVLTRTANGTAVDFGYNLDGRLIQAGNLTLNRDAQTGILIGTQLGTVTTENTVNGFGEFETVRARIGGSDLFMYELERDALGRISRRTETILGATTVYENSYDAAGRLNAVTADGTLLATYDYDDNDNQTARIDTGGSFVGVYDDQDRALSFADYVFEYGANGDLQRREDGATGDLTSYEYDVLGNLRRVDLADGTVIEYVVDATNRRIGKKVDGSLSQGMLYKDLLAPVAELDGAGNIVSRFVYGSKINVPDYMIRDGNTYRILSDHLGSPRIVIDVASGDIVQQLEYDAFGKVLADSNPGFQPFGFAGGIYDVDTGLTRFGVRDYDATIGRFTTKDAIYFDGGSTNLYSYASNDPINRGDLNGYQGICDVLGWTTDGADPSTTYGQWVLTTCNPGEVPSGYSETIDDPEFGKQTSGRREDGTYTDSMAGPDGQNEVRTRTYIDEETGEVVTVQGQSDTTNGDGLADDDVIGRVEEEFNDRYEAYTEEEPGFDFKDCGPECEIPFTVSCDP
jgi:RHS repeat-associated protein